MNYDTMSVDALLAEYVHAQWIGFYTGVESEISLKAALRHKVIREASVGIGTVRRAGEQPLPDAPQMFVPWETKDGDYDLILHKETT